MGIVEKLGGIQPFTAAIVIVTGIGTSRVVEEGEIPGAMKRPRPVHQWSADHLADADRVLKVLLSLMVFKK